MTGNNQICGSSCLLTNLKSTLRLACVVHYLKLFSASTLNMKYEHMELMTNLEKHPHKFEQSFATCLFGMNLD